MTVAAEVLLVETYAAGTGWTTEGADFTRLPVGFPA